MSITIMHMACDSSTNVQVVLELSLRPGDDFDGHSYDVLTSLVTRDDERAEKMVADLVIYNRAEQPNPVRLTWTQGQVLRGLNLPLNTEITSKILISYLKTSYKVNLVF